MLLCFELSMPGCNSWNGRWSGEDQYYAIVKSLGNSKKSMEKATAILRKGYYHYGFGDGWAAGVSVRAVNASEAAKIRRKSHGFSGYDWMVDSILQVGEIMTGDDLRKRLAEKR